MLICSLLIIQMTKKEFCEKRFNMVIHYDYYNCLYREEPPWSGWAGGGRGVDRPPLTHSTIALTVNQRTRDPGPVLAERELSLLAEGVGSRP